MKISTGAKGVHDMWKLNGEGGGKTWRGRYVRAMVSGALAEVGHTREGAHDAGEFLMAGACQCVVYGSEVIGISREAHTFRNCREQWRLL